MNPYRPTPKTRPLAMPRWVHGLVFWTATICIGLAAASSMGCGQPVFPTLSAIEQTIANDLAAGKSDAQIASDVCADLGGTAQTDAVCANVEVIVQDAIALLVSTGVLKGVALDNAHAYQLRHSAPASK